MFASVRSHACTPKRRRVIQAPASCATRFSNATCEYIAKTVCGARMAGLKGLVMPPHRLRHLCSRSLLEKKSGPTRQIIHASACKHTHSCALLHSARAHAEQEFPCYDYTHTAECRKILSMVTEIGRQLRAQVHDRVRDVRRTGRALPLDVLPIDGCQRCRRALQ
jgi:hypothetical protein